MAPNVAYALHLWPLNSEGSLTSNTYCDMKHLFIMVMTLAPNAECLLLDFTNIYYNIIFIINLIYIFDKLKWVSMFHNLFVWFFLFHSNKKFEGLIFGSLRATVHRGFFSVPHLLWHGISVYNGHLRRAVTLTPVVECLAVELSLPVFTTYVCPDRGSNLDLPHARRTLWPLSHRDGKDWMANLWVFNCARYSDIQCW